MHTLDRKNCIRWVSIRIKYLNMSFSQANFNTNDSRMSQRMLSEAVFCGEFQAALVAVELFQQSSVMASHVHG